MKLLITLLVLLTAAPLSGQTLERADTLNAEGSFEEAVIQYRVVLEGEPSNGQAWYGLGRALQSLERYDEALEAFERAGEIGFQPGGVMFRKGTIFLERGQLDQAKEWLTMAAKNGVPVHAMAGSFPSFQKVADNHEFQIYLASLAPCSSAEYRQFDFWTGNWDVYNPSGQKVGENAIESILGGCVILESWQGGTGGAGKSFNRYDQESETWSQHWVFNNGSEMFLVGTFADGRMVLETPSGVSPRQRWTWYEIEPGKVRQKAEQLSESGEWSTTWDSIYIPKGTAYEPVELD